MVHDIRRTLVIALFPVYLTSCALAILIFVFAEPLASIFFHGEGLHTGVTYIRLLVLFLPTAAATPLLYAAIRGFGTIRPNVIMEGLAKPIARLVLVLLAIVVGQQSSAIPLAFALPVIPAFIISALILSRKLVRAESNAVSSSVPTAPPRSAPELAREFWAFSAPRGVAAMFEISIVWADVLIVGAVLSPAAAAAYAAASRFVTAGTLALGALRAATAPEITATFARRQFDRTENLHRAATAWIVTCSWPAYFLLAVFAPLVMGLFGGKFDDAATALTILALGMLFNLVTGNVQTVLLMGGQSRWQLANTGVALAVNVVLNLVLDPHFGLTGAALAWTASIAIDNIATVVQVRLLLGLRTFSRAVALAAAAASVCFGVVGLLVRLRMGPGLLGLLVTIALGSSLYAALLWRFRHLLQLSQLRQALPGRHGRSKPRTSVSATRAKGDQHPFGTTFPSASRRPHEALPAPATQARNGTTKTVQNDTIQPEEVEVS